MCLAVGAMFTWQVWSVAIGETAVESYDYQYYRKVATSRGEVCHEYCYIPNSSDTLAVLPKFL